MKRTISLLLSILMLLTLLAGCGDGGQQSGVSSSGGQQSSSAGTTEPESAEPHILHLGTSAISTLSPLMANAAENNMMIFTQGTLYTAVPKEDGSAVEYIVNLAAAEPEAASDDGTVWTIKVDPNAKWDNGDPITAETFIYSWKQEIDPKLVCTQAALFSSNVITIKNALAYFKGEITDFNEVGVKALDENTLQITTEQACTAYEVKRHFCAYWTGPVHPELFESCKNSDGTASTYGSSVELTRFAGPMVVKNWVKGSIREMVRNENYLHKDRIKLDGIVNAVVQGTATLVQMFEKGELDYISLDASTAVQYADDPRLSLMDSRYVRQIHFADNNTENPIVGNLNFKKAIYYAINRAEIARLSQSRPANFIVPYTTVGAEDGTLFRDLPAVQAYTDSETYDYDPELAVQYFEKALDEMNMTSVSVTLTHTSGGTDKTIGEYLQEQLAKVFGEARFQLKLNGVPNATRLNIHKESNTNPNAYELILRYWSLSSSDFDAPQALVMLTSSYHQKFGWNLNEKIQSLYDESRLPENRADIDKLSEYGVKMEQEYLESCVTVPVTEDTTKVLIAERVVLPLERADTAQGWCLLYADVTVD